MDRIPPDLTPTHIAYLKAKSADHGGDTLAEHTWAVLKRLADQHRLRPNLTALTSDDRLWHRLYWGCFLHDFGKAAAGFQERLAAPERPNAWSEGKHRHEVLSLAFIDWLFPPAHPDRLPIISVVVSHHKDADDIFAKYGSGRPTSDQQRRVEFLVAQITPQVADDLWLWLEGYGSRWLQALGLPEFEAPVPANRAAFGLDAIHRALADFKGHLLAYEDGEMADADRLRDIHYRGLILTADHSASAGVDAFPDLLLTRDIAAHPLRSLQHWHSHQADADRAGEGSAILVAPTGSGKTESAMLWAAQQIQHRPAPRLFYTLPYQASMNAMAHRLADKFFGVNFTSPENHTVAIQHSRATLKFYQDMMEADSGANPLIVARKAKARAELAHLHYFPVKVFSPYQMLQAAYSLKGYEALLVDYADALFIFDEIHAYEPSRLALIITFMGWLAAHYHARFLVMTATLPPTVERALKGALPGCKEIVARSGDFQASQRHLVHLHEDDLLDHLALIAEDARQGKAVLVCCNQVARAQEVYRRLKEEYDLSREQVMLLHGRFNGKDRGEKERLLAQRVGVRSQTRRRPYVIVATQVVEVSLDIDLDTLYTDPAPLDALLQRFGRVNRGRPDKTLCPVQVFRQPVGMKESKPYNADLVQAGLDVLEHYCDDKAIDEALVTTMLGDIYQGDIERRWQQEYDSTARKFTMVLRNMQPFQSASPDIYHQFYRLFDGTQILPLDCLEEYLDAIERRDYLGASQYLVNVSWGQHGQIKQAGLNKGHEENEFADHVDIPYDREWGLDIAGALAAKRAEFRDEEE